MIGSIAGDIIGSVYEHRPIKTKDFPLFGPQVRFTDDTVLTVAVAAAILADQPYIDAVRWFGRRYPDAGYGGSFFRWLHDDDPQPYRSWGNGAAMRVSPVGFAFATEDEVRRQARMTAAITHDHPEGIKGAEAAALTVFLARSYWEKEDIRKRITTLFGYDLDRRIDDIRPVYRFDISCQGTVPEAIIAFLDGDSYEDTVRNAVSLGGDSDTLACIAGGMAEAFYGGVPPVIRARVEQLLPAELWQVTTAFSSRYCI